MSREEEIARKERIVIEAARRLVGSWKYRDHAPCTEPGIALAQVVEELNGLRPACTCAQIMAADHTRHFRECPLRVEYSETDSGTLQPLARK